LWVICLMHGKKLMADQVVTRGQCSGDGDGSFESVENSVTCPYTLVLGSGYETLFEDLDYSSSLVSQ
jgi:hypothetical protein